MLYLLVLLQPLADCDIPDVLFERVRFPQHRWTDCGDQIEITALEAGLDKRLVNLVSEESQLLHIIQKLDPFVRLNRSTDGLWTCSLDS